MRNESLRSIILDDRTECYVPCILGRMDEKTEVRLSGRQAQAARNDQLILEAARAVFTADPGAPISAVAEHAGVGISALYRRYRSKEDLLRQLAMDGLQRYITIVEAALAAEGDAWNVFAEFMRHALDADTHSLTLHLAGTFTPTAEMWSEGDRASRLTVDFIERTKAGGVLRPDFEVGDVSLIFEQLAALNVGSPKRSNELRHRYLAMLLEALRNTSGEPLPGPAPSWEEISARYVG
jgi:AcrR family transcriptional regulator